MDLNNSPITNENKIKLEDEEDENEYFGSFEEDADTNDPESKSMDSSLFDGNYDVRCTGETAALLRIRLTETEHQTLLDIPCIVVKPQAKRGNNHYEVRNVLKVTTGTQTPQVRQYHIGTCLPLPESKDCTTFVNNEILHDSYSPRSGKNEGWENWDVGLTMNRLLARNIQPPLQGALEKLPSDPFQRHLVFSYTPKVLVELADPQIAEGEIADMAFNPAQPDILATAISFGSTGAIAIYSLKNIVCAERIFRLKDPAVCLSFSKKSPNLLAVGFKNGTLFVVDISGPVLKVIHREPASNYYMVRVVQWWAFGDSEEVIFCTGSRVLRLKRPFLSSHPAPLMTVSHPDTEGLRMVDAPLTLGPAVLCLLRSSCPDQYLLGCSDGYIRACSVHSSLEFLQRYKAHVGVVSAIKAVPHCAKVNVTCGCDGRVKLWAQGIPSPLLILKAECATDELVDVCWSPLHATVAVAASPTALYVWDIRRRTHTPVASAPMSHRVNNIQFSDSGEYLIVGTENGKLIFMGLVEMPFPEMYKRDAFAQAVTRNLNSLGQYDVVECVNRLGIFQP